MPAAGGRECVREVDLRLPTALLLLKKRVAGTPAARVAAAAAAGVLAAAAAAVQRQRQQRQRQKGVADGVVGWREVGHGVRAQCRTQA